MLKTMVPQTIDESTKKSLVITRNMRKNEEYKKDSAHKKHNEKNGNTNPKEPDQLKIWDCTSISDIKLARKLEFILEESTKEIKIENNSALNQTRVRCSDNPDYLDNMLEKLPSVLGRLSFVEFALEKGDEIFKKISIEKFKEKINKSRERNIIILLYSNPQRITDERKKRDLIKLYHSTPCGGHFGVRKTLIKLKQKYIWKNMYKMVKKYVVECDLCQRNKQIRHTKEPLCITDTPKGSFETVVIDTVGPLRPSRHYRYILTMQCELTKYVVAAPIETKEAKSVAKCLIENLILKYGIFKVLKSDRGTEFVNELMKEICTLLRIEHKISTPYHHETLGTVERNHRVLNEYFLSFVNDDCWNDWIPFYCFAYNITPHVDTNYSPFELVFGKLPELPGEQILNGEKIYNIENYANELRARLKNSLECARKLVEITKEKRSIESYNNKNSIDLEIGDLVLVKLNNRKKNEAPYTGPYEVINIDNVNVELKINGKTKIVHKNLLKKYNRI